MQVHIPEAGRPPGEGHSNHSTLLAGESHGQRSPAGSSVRCDWSDWAHTVNMGICPTRLFHGKAVMFIRQSFPWNESNFLKRWIWKKFHNPENVFRNQNVFKVNERSSKYINATHYLTIKMIFQNLKLNHSIIFGCEEALVQNMTFQVRKIWLLMLNIWPWMNLISSLSLFCPLQNGGKSTYIVGSWLLNYVI